MVHILKSKARRYRSALRDEQAAATRQRIIDGLVKALAEDGIGGPSIPAVARAAGVSVPTVYRYFPAKADLIEALASVYERELDEDEWLPPIYPIEEWDEALPTFFERYKRIRPELRAAMLTDIGHEARLRMMPRRVQWADEVLAPYVKGIPRRDRERLRNLFIVLTGSPVQRAFADYFDIDAKDAAKTVVWGLRKLIEGAGGGKQ